MIRSSTLAFSLVCAVTVPAQLDSIMDQGVYRTFITHLPAGYSASNEYPIVFSMHGLNSNAAQQQAYSAFDPIADTAGFIAVYPNAVNGSWDLSGTGTDVTFLSNLLDTMNARYSTNGCLFYTGMSQGGFMTYVMGCSSGLPITAISVVAGNMTVLQQLDCPVPAGLPVLHFHGTADGIVSYQGAFGIPPVEETVAWWADKNGCDQSPQVTALPNTVIEDSCTVDRVRYANGVNGSEVTLYRINNGGHTWPGGIPIPLFGFTDQDISASAISWNFFRSYCPAITSIKEHSSSIFSIAPNPAQDHAELSFAGAPSERIAVVLFDQMGRSIKTWWPGTTSSKSRTIELDLAGVVPGVYIVQVINGEHLIKPARLIVE